MRFFKKKAPSFSGPSVAPVLPPSSRSSSLPEITYDDTDLVDESVAVSDGETLYRKTKPTQLQDTYSGNYTDYLPFVLTRMGREPRPPPNYASTDYDSDDSTILDGEYDFDHVDHGTVMEADTSAYNLKREHVVVEEAIKHITYLFVSQEAFDLFVSLRKKPRKDVKVTHESNGRVTLSSPKREGAPLNGAAEYVDTRQHIIPLEYRLTGLGLPLLKLQVPYLNLFRKNAPYIIIKRYREVPLRPGTEPDGEDYETYVFCKVFIKYHDTVRTVTFQFFHADSSKMVEFFLFLHNEKRYADFVYKGTRFRMLGTPLLAVYMPSYDFKLKLVIIDDNKPSLCDSVIQKQSTSFLKRNKNAGVSTYPYPDPNGPLMALGPKEKRMYISDQYPPFGKFNHIPERGSFIPKKFHEVGTMEVYQNDFARPLENLDSVKSVDDDTLIIDCVFLSLREIGVRSTAKASRSTEDRGAMFIGNFAAM